MPVKAVLNGTVLAEAEDALVVESNYYFHPSAVKKEFLSDTDTSYECSWKGSASYFDATVNGNTVKDAAWSYPNTTEKGKYLENYIAFAKDKVNVEEYY